MFPARALNQTPEANTFNASNQSINASFRFHVTIMGAYLIVTVIALDDREARE